MNSLPGSPPCSKHTSGWGPISLESRSAAITASGWWYWAQGSTSSHAGSPKHWVAFPCAVLLTRIPKHMACFLLYVIQIPLILVSILPAFQDEEVTGLYLTAQHRIIHQRWQQLCVPGRDETRVGFSWILCFLFPYSNCFWNKVTFNNLLSEVHFIACSKSQPWTQICREGW